MERYDPLRKLVGGIFITGAKKAGKSTFMAFTLRDFFEPDEHPILIYDTEKSHATWAKSLQSPHRLVDMLDAGWLPVDFEQNPIATADIMRRLIDEIHMLEPGQFDIVGFDTWGAIESAIEAQTAKEDFNGHFSIIRTPRGGVPSQTFYPQMKRRIAHFTGLCLQKCRLMVISTHLRAQFMRGVGPTGEQEPTGSPELMTKAALMLWLEPKRAQLQSQYKARMAWNPASVINPVPIARVLGQRLSDPQWFQEYGDVRPYFPPSIPNCTGGYLVDAEGKIVLKTEWERAVDWQPYSLRWYLGGHPADYAHLNPEEEPIDEIKIDERLRLLRDAAAAMSATASEESTESGDESEEPQKNPGKTPRPAKQVPQNLAEFIQQIGQQDLEEILLVLGLDIPGLINALSEHPIELWEQVQSAKNRDNVEQ